jgi:hypothetical protein
MPQIHPYQAHISLNGKQSGEAQIILDKRKIGMLHSITDKPGAKFDLKIIDMNGNEQIVRKDVGTENTRWGEVVDKNLTDNTFIVKVENVRGADTIDIFCE